MLFSAGLALLAASMTAKADPMVTTEEGPLFGFSKISSTQFHMQPFTLASGWTNVAISARFANATGNPFPIAAYLTDKVGVGTIPAQNTIKSGVVYLPNGNDFVPIFSNLTLGPGTYFIVLSALINTSDAGLAFSPFSTYTVAPGVTFGESQVATNLLNLSYAPGSLGFAPVLPGAYRSYTITGTPNAGPPPPPAAVPEGAVSSLLLVVCAMPLGIRRFRRVS